MQVLFPCFVFLVVENVQLVKNEHLDDQEVLESTQFKNAVAKELLKKKLSTLESARQQDSLASFLRKGGKNLSGLRTAPKSSYHKDDDPSRKQAQMANTFIASSNLLFGAKSQQRKACGTGGKSANKEVLDMRSLRQTYSGYNEEGSEFSASKEVPKAALETPNGSIAAALKKRSYAAKAMQDPISCYLTEPKKVTCMHKDIIYKIALPTSDVADDEIGRIVESIYRAVEGKSIGKSSLDIGDSSQMSLTESEAAASKKRSAEDSLKKKRASEDYLRSLFLNKALANYNSNNPVFIPLLIPITQQKPDLPKVQNGYYSGLAIDPRLQIPMNLSVGVDPVGGYQAGRNLLFDNGYGQYLVPEALPELNLKQRSQANLSAEEEKRRNWLALMATNGLVPVENGVNPKVLTHLASGEVQSLAEEKESLSSDSNKLTAAETGAFLEKLLNTRQQRDTYFLRRQLRKKPVMEERSALTPFNSDGRKHGLSEVVQKLSDPGGYILEEKKGCPCPCPCPSDSPDAGASIRKPTKCPPKYPMFNFPLTSPPSNQLCCSSTTRCATTKCPSTCPEGCQPVSSSQCETTNRCETTSPRCETTSPKPCTTKFNLFGDSDVLSKVVSVGKKRNEEPQMNGRNSLPVQTSHQNWLPYSPQLIPQNRPLGELANQPGQPHFASQKDQDSQQYFASEDGRSRLQYSTRVNQHPKQSKDAQVFKSEEKADSSGMPNQEQQPGMFEEEQPQQPIQTNVVRNQIQVNYKQLTAGQGTNDSPAQSAEAPLGDTNESQNKPNSQTDHNNTAAKQNEAKNKKHRDSFFARLRSKFHKGIPPTDQEIQYSHQNQHIQNKAILGTSIFKFNPRNQTTGSGKYSSSSTIQPMDSQQCFEEQTNQSNDRTLTLTNQSQPSTVNNINITITSQPQQGAQGVIQANNQTMNQSSKGAYQCSNRSALTAGVAYNGPSSRICKVTKIWLCSRSTSNPLSYSNDTCTQPSTCSTNQSTTCTATQPTCATPPSSSTFKTGLTTCQTTTVCTTTCPPSTCGGSMNFGSNDSQPSYDIVRVDNNTQSSTCGTPSTPMCGSNGSPGTPLPKPYDPWAPGDSQMPPGMPRPPPDSSQGSPGAKIKTLFYGPYPVWNQWQYPVDRMSPHHSEQNLNWPQQTRVPLPTPYVPQVPPQKLPAQHPTVPTSTPFNQGQYPKQADPFLPQPQRQTYGLQNPTQPQMHNPVWQQPPSRQLELDPRWQNVQPRYPYQQSNAGLTQSNGTEFQYHEGTNTNNVNGMWSNNTTMIGDPVRGIRTVELPANIKQHIARVRRYLLKKRSKMSKPRS